MLGSLAGIASFVVVPGIASAADEAPAADASLVLEEVTVTANKLNATKVLDTPTSIQAISGDALQNAGVSGIMDIAGDIPGLSIQDLGPGDKKYVIRGINSTGAATTGVYYGEAVISGSNADDGGGFESDIRLYDMDHIEVLRGPQGTLYGASSMSGTLRFIPKAPDLNTVSGYGTVEGSETAHTERENYNFNGAVNLPLIDGVLAVRLVGWKEYDAGYINQIRVGTGVTGLTASGPPATPGGAPTVQTTSVNAIGLLKGVNDDDVGGGRVMVRYQPFDRLTIDANYTEQTETSGGSSRYTPAGTTAFNLGPITPVQGCDLCNTDVTQSPWSDNLKVFGTTITYDTGVGTVTGTTNQFNRRTDFNFDSTPVLVSFDVPVPAETLEPRYRQVNSSELRYASAFDFPVNFVAGVYREHEHQFLNVDVLATNGNGLPIGPFCDNNSCDAGAYPGTGTTFFGRSDERWTTSYAGFGEVTWKATDALTATAGIRYFTESLEGVQIQTHPFGGFPATDTNLVPVYDPNETFNKVTWKGNVSYKFDEALLAYATVSTGFRSGGLNAVSEPFEPIPVAYKPDSLTNFELGAKGRLLNGLFDYQADVYFIRWSDIQEQETTADGAFVYQGNAGDGEGEGRGARAHCPSGAIPYGAVGRLVAGGVPLLGRRSADRRPRHSDDPRCNGVRPQSDARPYGRCHSERAAHPGRFRPELHAADSEPERLGWHGSGGYQLSRPGEFLLRVQLLQHSAVVLHAGQLAARRDQGSVERDRLRPQPDRQAGADLGDQLLAGPGCAADHSAADDWLDGHAEVLKRVRRIGAATRV